MMQLEGSPRKEPGLRTLLKTIGSVGVNAVENESDSRVYCKTHASKVFQAKDSI